MSKLTKRRTAGMVAIMVACIAGASAYAFTASNTGLAPHKAGSIAVAISGYVVTIVDQSVTPDGLNYNGVTFTLDSAASDVQMAYTAGTPTLPSQWQDCGASGALSPWLVTCTLATPVPKASATLLTVVAVENGTATIKP